MEPDGPVVILAVDRIAQWLALRMALDAGVVRADKVEPGRIDDIRPARIRRVFAPGTMAALAADVPFLHRLCLDVVIDRVATVTQRPGRTARVLRGIERHP